MTSATKIVSNLSERLYAVTNQTIRPPPFLSTMILKMFPNGNLDRECAIGQCGGAEMKIFRMPATER